MIGPRAEVVREVAAAFPEARIEPLAGDASTRRFWRIRGADGDTRVLMDYGKPFEDETDDVRLARIFREAGLPVAEVLDIWGPAGCILLEDLGNTTLESAVVQPNGLRRPEARELLERAVLLATRVAESGTAALARSDRRAGPALDSERFRFEMDYFLEHYARGLRRCDPPPGLRSALHALADRAADTPRPVLCHRDFHSRNLMVRAGGGLAMVDVQDARWGPDCYDLASLVRDAYIEVDEWLDPLVELYVSTLREPPPEGFHSRFRRVSAQRMLKALGTFGYQVAEREDLRYMSAIPRTVRRLNALLPSMTETRPLHDLLVSADLL